MKTASHYYMLSDFAKRERQQLINPSVTRRLRFWWHYWTTGRYTVRAAWLLAGGR